MSEWGINDYANNVPKYLTTNFPGNTNVFLVDASRLANATFSNGKVVTHQGWVKIFQGIGYISALSVSANTDPKYTYANTFLTFTGANTTGANARLVVLNGNNVSVVLNAGGTGYSSAPTISANVAGSNNNILSFTITPGGRMGRVQAETLVCLSSPNVTDANSGLPYFTGL